MTLACRSDDIKRSNRPLKWMGNPFMTWKRMGFALPLTRARERFTFRCQIKTLNHPSVKPVQPFPSRPGAGDFYPLSRDSSDFAVLRIGVAQHTDKRGHDLTERFSSIIDIVILGFDEVSDGRQVAPARFGALLRLS